MEENTLCYHDKLWIPFVSKTTTMLLLMSTLVLSTITEALHLTGGNVTVVQGETAILPCTLDDTLETLSQISWQRLTRAKTQKDNFYTVSAGSGPSYVNGNDGRFKFIGSFKDNNGSLELSSVLLADEGIYTCIFTLFPSGNHKTEIPLNLLVPPVISLKDNFPVLGNEEVSLVTCTASASRPPAEVSWITGTMSEKVKVTTNLSSHANGTTTTESWLSGLPTREINKALVQCVVTHPALLEKETLPFTLQVYFPPTEVKITEKSEDSFECVTEANPTANFTWSRSDLQPLPQSAVRVEGATLHFLTMTPDLNGPYLCEASNQFGRKRGHLYVHKTSGACTACWTLFSLLVILIAVAAAVVWYLHKTGRLQRAMEGTTGKRQKVRRTSSTPDVVGGVEEEIQTL